MQIHKVGNIQRLKKFTEDDERFEHAFTAVKDNSIIYPKAKNISTL